MDETERALRAIDEAVAWLERLRETGPVQLTAKYLAAIRAIEELPENQSGSDKTWVKAADEQFTNKR